MRHKNKVFATPYNNKLGWFNMHNDHRRLLQKKGPSIIITGNSSAAGLRKSIFQRQSVLILVEIECSTSYDMLVVLTK